MAVRRLFIFMLFMAICGTVSVPVAFADEHGTSDLLNTGTCQIDENYKKQIAETGCTAAKNALNFLAQFNKIVNDEYKAANGACADISVAWSEAGHRELTYDKNTRRGAEAADEILNTGSQCKGYIEEANDAEGYTDIAVWRVQGEASPAKAYAEQILNWAKISEIGAKTPYLPKGGGLGSTFNFDILKTDIGFVILKGDLPPEYYDPYNYNSCSGSSDSKYCKAAEKIVSISSIDDVVKILPQEFAKSIKCADEMEKATKIRGREPGADENSFIGQRKIASAALSVLSGRLDVECRCTKDENGNVTEEIESCTAYNDDFREDNYEDDCKTISLYQYDLDQYCLTCGLMAKILGTVQKISRNAFEAISLSLVKLLILAYLIYIAYVVLITIASPEMQKISKFLTTITTQGAKVAITILILQVPGFLYSNFINPLLDGSVDFSLALTGSDRAMIAEIGADEKYAANFEQSNNYLSAKTLEALVGATANFSKEATLMPAIGRSFICNAWHNLGIKRVGIIPRISMFVQGIILLIFGIGIWLAIGFYLLDCALQLGIIAALMAFLVACWPFKMTIQYTKAGWNMFLNTFFNFIMMSVIIVTINTLSVQAISSGMTRSELEMYLNNNEADELEERMDVVGIQIFMLVTCCMIAYKMTSESRRLANKFSAGAKIAMGADLGGLAADTASKVVKGAAKSTAHGVAALGGSIAENSGLKGAATAAKQRITGQNKAANASFAGRGATNPTGGPSSTGSTGGSSSSGSSSSNNEGSDDSDENEDNSEE